MEIVIGGSRSRGREGGPGRKRAAARRRRNGTYFRNLTVGINQWSILRGVNKNQTLSPKSNKCHVLGLIWYVPPKRNPSLHRVDQLFPNVRPHISSVVDGSGRYGKSNSEATRPLEHFEQQMFWTLIASCARDMRTVPAIMYLQLTDVLWRVDCDVYAFGNRIVMIEGGGSH